MEVDTDLVRDVAQLAQLKIDKNDLADTIKDLNGILLLADQMESIDTTGIPPMSNPLDATQRLRKDQVTQTNHRELYQTNAPQIEDGYFLVPRVVEWKWKTFPLRKSFAI